MIKCRLPILQFSGFHCKQYIKPTFVQNICLYYFLVRVLNIACPLPILNVYIYALTICSCFEKTRFTISSFYFVSCFWQNPKFLQNPADVQKCVKKIRQIISNFTFLNNSLRFQRSIHHYSCFFLQVLFVFKSATLCILHHNINTVNQTVKLK